MINRQNITKLIQKIWHEELITKREFSKEDDFFELGGNSLKLISILDKFQRAPELGGITDLSIIELFDNPKFEELIDLINSKLPKR